MYLLYEGKFLQKVSVPIREFANYMERDEIPVLDTRDGVVEYVPKSWAKNVVINPMIVFSTKERNLFGANDWNEYIAKKPSVAFDSNFYREFELDAWSTLNIGLNRNVIKAQSDLYGRIIRKPYNRIVGDKAQALQWILSGKSKKTDILFPPNKDVEPILYMGQYTYNGKTLNKTLVISDWVLIGGMQIISTDFIKFRGIRFMPAVTGVKMCDGNNRAVVFEQCSFRITKIRDGVTVVKSYVTPLTGLDVTFDACGDYTDLVNLLNYGAAKVTIKHPVISRQEFERLKSKCSDVKEWVYEA